MRELSLYILDLVQNSLAADANLVIIEVLEDQSQDRLEIVVSDNGRGMSSAMVQMVFDPFVTSRTTRKVGLGIPLLEQHARECNGQLIVESTLERGTTVRATLGLSHINRVPLGNIADTFMVLVAANPQVDFRYRHGNGHKEFIVDTREMRVKLGKQLPLNTSEVLEWLRQYLIESEARLMEV